MNRGAALAVFVSPHGFGHAARACAVMEAIRRQAPRVRFEVFTAVAEPFFRQSVAGGCRYHRVRTDVGFVQKTPFVVDLDATVRALDDFLPVDEGTCGPLAEQVRRLDCAAVLCDISPLGIAVARTAGLPSVLVENFTWDWIYEAYADRCPAMKPHAEELARIFARADIHIQAAPVCRPAPVDLTVEPVSRAVRTDPVQVREQIDAPAGRPMVLISLGGVSQRAAYLDRLSRRPDLFFVVVNAAEEGRIADHLLALDPFSGPYHPDLVNAADALIGKAGYSTVAEVCRTGTPFGYSTVDHFKETGVLKRFIEARLSAVALDPATFSGGGWIDRLDALLASPRRPVPADGADRIAGFLIRRLGMEKE